MNYQHYQIKNFLNEDEIASLQYDDKIVIESDTGDLTLFNQKSIAQTIVEKISKHIGPVEVGKSHV